MERSRSPTALPAYEEWPSVPTAPLRAKSNDEQFSPMDIDELKSNSDRTTRQTSELSLNEYEAVQVLESLKGGMKTLYPLEYSAELTVFLDTRQPRRPSSVAPKIDPALQSSQHQSSEQPEPLLALFTSRHPILSRPINGSLNYYSSSKEYSPIVKYGAEFVERLGSPVVNTVGNAGKISGVETGVRWWLQRSESDSAQRGSKRRRTDQSPMDVDMERGVVDFASPQGYQRRPSEVSHSDAPPLYDAQRSPEYEEKSPSHQPHNENHREYHTSWSTRLIKSTSGLGVAMSEESLTSLRWALSCLSWANRHLTRLIIRLRDAIEQSDRAKEALSPRKKDSNRQEDAQITHDEESTAASRKRETHVKSLAAEVVYIIKMVNNGVAEYAASSLPENARILVGKYFKSLRISFLHSFAGPSNGDGESEGISGSQSSARKALLLAREALDKLAQISGIVEGTIVSAEEWCARLGRRRHRTPAGGNGDLNMPADRKEPLLLTTVNAPPMTKDDKEPSQPLIDTDVAMADKEETARDTTTAEG